jgi:outer membrane lipoprotein-sorting protein
MNRFRKFIAVLLLCACQTARAVLPQEAMNPETKRVLARMDQAGKQLVDLTADIRQTKVTLVVNDTSTDTGKLFLKRTKSGNRTKLEYQKPVAKTLLIDKGKVLIYEPRINTLQEVDLGKNRAQAEFLLTGVGQSSGNLTRTHDVKFLKEEAVKGTKTSLLELRPKGTSMFVSIWLWVDMASGLPIQTRLTESSGDYLTLQLENIKLNPKLSDKVFKLSLPSDVQRIKAISAR